MIDPRLTRRTLIRTLAYAGAVSPLVLPRLTRAVAPNSKLNLASVGVAGKGWEDLISSSGDGKVHNVVALCDIDHRDGGTQPGNLGKAQAARPLGIGAAAKRFPKAARFADFRQMLEKVKEIDAITVTTPDHMHATIAVTAMLLGKHVYVQKPLAARFHETVVMRDLARRNKIITQMGNQFHSSIGYRCLVQVIQSGAIGKVREVHAWTNSPNWPQGIDRPAGEDAVPEGVHWDLWLGVAPARPFKQFVYHNFNWRGWQDFGTGSLGDMGCHVIDPAFWSLQLTAPSAIRSTSPTINRETYPAHSVVRFEFPATAYTTGPLPLTWYDAGQLPPAHLVGNEKSYRLPANGSMFVGEKGTLVTAHAPSVPRLFPESKFDDYSHTTLRDLYKSIPPQDHYRNWTDAIQSGTQACSHFDYAAPLAQVVLLGTIAQRLPGTPLTWDANAMKFPGNDAATAMLRREYRAGWGLPILA